MRLLIVILLSSFLYCEIIPSGYYKYKDTLYKEIDRTFPTFYVPPYFAALIEHESCISLKHSRCWNPNSRLKTSREEGAGLSQLTRAYRVDGSLRFDTIRNLVQQHPRDLRELNWNNVYDRPDLQIRAMILLWKSNFRNFNSDKISYWDKMAFSDASYNAGYGNVYKDMQVCKFKENCNPMIWFDNVNTINSRTKILYGNRSASDIVHHHVKDVLINNLPKYIEAWSEDRYYDKYIIKIE